jgi:hypothetical protein
MAIKVPQNKIIVKYTSSGEYVVKDTNKKYTGYYYDLNGVTYAGKEYNAKNPILIKITSENYNSLLSNIKTALYGVISNVGIPNTPKITSAYSNPADSAIRYFIKKINVTPILIKEVTKDTFTSIKINPLYQTLEVNYRPNLPEVTLNELDKKMPGIKDFLLEESINTSGLEPNPALGIT